MTHFKPFARGLFVMLLLAGLLAGVIVPTFAPVKAAPPMQAATHVVISEFRTSGPSGGNDEFIEFFNPTSGTVDISGWQVKGSSSTGTTITTKYTFPASTTLLPGQHYLIVNNSANGYSGSIPSNGTYTSSIADNGGIALINPANPATPVDQVGMSITSAYKEGNILAPLSGTLDHSYDRNADLSGSCIDTDNNATDFFLRNISDPQNLSSTITTCGNPTPLPPPPPTPVPLHTVIINEVAWAGTGTSAQKNPNDEWIELYNPGTVDINLSGWRLVTDDGKLDITLSGTISGGSGSHYFLIGRYADIFTSGATINLPFTNSMGNWLSLDNNGTTLRLLGPNGATVDIANSTGGAWYAGATYPNYASMERFLWSSSLNDIQSDWKTFGGTPSAYDRNGKPVYGTPGQSNWALTLYLTPTPTPTITRTPTVTFSPTVTGTLPTPTRTKRPTEIPPTPFAHVVINEFLPRAGFDWNNDGVIDFNDEFIEIENLGPINVNLSGWKLSDDPNIGGKTFALPSQTLKPGERAVFYGSTTHILLVDSGDTIRLINSRGVIVDARGYGVVKYADQSHCRIPDGNGYWQLTCFPTPGNANVLTGTLPSAPPAKINQPAPCLLPDTTPLEFRLAECNPYGADIWNDKYWNDSAGQKQFIIPDPFSKGEIIVE